MYFQDSQVLIAFAWAPFVLVPIGAAVATLLLLIIVDAVEAMISPPRG